jgi:hypothetical protein
VFLDISYSALVPEVLPSWPGSTCCSVQLIPAFYFVPHFSLYPLPSSHTLPYTHSLQLILQPTGCIFTAASICHSLAYVQLTPKLPLLPTSQLPFHGRNSAAVTTPQLSTTNSWLHSCPTTNSHSCQTTNSWPHSCPAALNSLAHISQDT